MTGGVVLIIGPLGLNFGSGMTGGLAYVLRADAAEVLHREFVTLADLESAEESWLRRVLEEHAQFTASPRAARLLSRHGTLPIVRVQPIHFQGSVAATWAPVLARLPQRETMLVPAYTVQLREAALHA
jgi:glutamate synthase (NADPH/NADH) large chain